MIREVDGVRSTASATHIAIYPRLFRLVAGCQRRCVSRVTSSYTQLAAPASRSARTGSAITSISRRGSCFTTPRLSAVARDCCGGVFPTFTAIIRWPGTRRWVNAHPIGVAVMQAPLFGVAHALTRWTNLSPDGFTLYYQHAAGLSGLFWIVAGLAMLRRVLRRHFSDALPRRLS